MREAMSLHAALKRHSRFTKAIARRHGREPILTLVLRDPGDPTRTVVYTEEDHPTDAMVAIQLAMLGVAHEETL